MHLYMYANNFFLKQAFLSGVTLSGMRHLSKVFGGKFLPLFFYYNDIFL